MSASDGSLRAILEQARWAPSGDNTQPWRFEMAGSRHVVVHGFDTRDHCVYDLDGVPSLISIGALLETLDIAASGHGLRARWALRDGLPAERPTLDVTLDPDASRPASPLAPCIAKRCVQRRAMSMRALDAAHRSALEQAAGAGFELVWLSSAAERWRAARLMFANAGLRLTMPEAYLVHRDIIDWGRTFSADRVPDQALGADAMTLKLMRFVMADWSRVRFFNRFLAGTVAPRLQMDLWPSLACGAHFWMRAAREPVTAEDHLEAGRAVQRVWLTATSLGLWQQPEMTPLIFSRYVRQGRPFTAVAAIAERATQLQARTAEVLGEGAERAVWMGRLGYGPVPQSRSIRRPLDELMVGPEGLEGKAGPGGLELKAGPGGFRGRGNAGRD